MKSRISMLISVLLTVAAALSVQAQTYSVLYNFGSESGDPAEPQFSGIVAQGRDGNLYSTAPNGGLGPFLGAVFKITTDGTLTVLHPFDPDGTEGTFPAGGLTLGSDGYFYGTAEALGGNFTDSGTVFKVTSTGSLTVLHNFGSDASDGASPYAPPIQATDGNFYGTTLSGGISACGTIYKITSSGTYKGPLYQFDSTHGCNPYGPLVQGTDGNFYGTTEGGGMYGDGVVFKITAAGQLSVLHNFQGGPDGAQPFAGLVQGTDGNFYGTAQFVVFKITPSGTYTVVYTMNMTSDGTSAVAGLVQATDGNFYGANSRAGMPSSGCPNGCGTTFKVKVTKPVTFTVLHNFDFTTGSTPYSALFQHTNGIVYGETQLGGTGNVSGCAGGNCGVFYSWTDSIHLPPFVTLLPYSGKVGKTIEFLGQNFTSSTTVTFMGAAPESPSFISTTGTYLTAAVPSGATSGFVTVTTSMGTLASNKKFHVTP